MYTRDGCGSLILRGLYEEICHANVNDVSGIYDLIDPLVRSGMLVDISKSQLEKDILSYYICIHSWWWWAHFSYVQYCMGQLKIFEGGSTEIGCLVVLLVLLVSLEYRKWDGEMPWSGISSGCSCSMVPKVSLC